MLDLETAPVNSEEVKLATRRDPLLGKVLNIVLWGSGGSRDMVGDLSVFKPHAEELAIEDGCILWGSRVVIPSILRGKVLEELHVAHPGICRHWPDAMSGGRILTLRWNRW